MSYYHNPYPQFPYASYEAERRDIQLRIADIQERLIIRREEQLNRRAEEEELERLRQYEAELLYRLSLEQEHQAKKIQQQRALKEAEEEKLQFQHLQKLQRIKREQDLLYQERLVEGAKIEQQDLRRLQYQRERAALQLTAQQKYQRDLQYYYHRKILKDPKNSYLAVLNNSIQYQDSEKGSRSDKDKDRDGNYDSIKKSNRNNKRLNSSSKGRSPFDKLKNDVTQFSYNDSGNKKSYLEETGTNRKNGNPEHANKISYSQNLTPPAFNPKGSIGNILNGDPFKEKVKQIITPQKKLKNRSLYPYRRLSNEKSKSKSNKISQIKKSMNISGNENGNQEGSAMAHQMQQNAMKKIENRLKLSTIVFQDSQKRNMKHQANHLFNTFQNQVKIRKQVRDKINNNPMILKKHKMVVE